VASSWILFFSYQDDALSNTRQKSMLHSETDGRTVSDFCLSKDSRAKNISK